MPVPEGQIPLRCPVADQVADVDADLRVRVVCVSQAAARKPVESQLRTVGDPQEPASVNRESGGCCAPFRGGLGCRLNRGLSPYQVVS